MPKPLLPLPEVQVETLAHGDIQSLTELDPTTLDPETHYRWVRADPLRIGKRRLKGYRVISPKEGVLTIAGYLDETSDGTMRIMDVILMGCPLEPWRARKRDQRKIGERRLSAPKKQFKKQARKRQARVIREEEEG